jgi:hypothetical protein
MSSAPPPKVVVKTSYPVVSLEITDHSKGLLTRLGSHAEIATVYGPRPR